jgi:L-iditol 2-dehydrogenase
LKAAIYYSNNDIRIEDIPVPKISNKEILVKIMASGVCGSDVMEWYRIKKAPLILGHEVAGVVSEVGNMVKNIKEGDRVVIAHHVPCNVCYHCLLGKHTVCDTLRKTNFDPGGFCEYVRVPEINLANSGIFFLPDNVSYEEGSFVEPLACVLRAQRLIGIQAGMTVLIIGAGISGVLHIALARATGASNVIGIDISDFRIKAALENGANHAFHFKDFNQEVLKKINNNRLADVFKLSTGAPQAL